MRQTTLAGRAAIVFLLLGAAPALAQQPPAAGVSSTATSGFATGPSQQVAQPGVGPLFGAPFGADHLFGDLGGARTWLQNRGVSVNLDYLTENGGNITGGQHQGFATAGQIGLEVDLDLDRLVGWSGAAFHSITVNREGTNLSHGAIGDDEATFQEIYGGGGDVGAHLVYAYLDQALLHNRLDLVGGWLPVGTFFASSPLYCDFINVLFCGNPHPLPNTPGENDWPQADFGAQLRVLLTPQIYLQVAAFQVDTSFGSGGGGRSGFAWADSQKSGVSTPVELGWVPRFGANQLVGHYKLGYDHDTHRYPNVLDNRQGLPQAIYGGAFASSDRDEFYVLFDQMLWRQGPGNTDGLIVLGGWVHATDSVTPLTQQAFVATTMTGAGWSRPRDTVGASFHWIEMSGAFTRAEELALETGGSSPFNVDGNGQAFGPQNTEQVAELTYIIHVLRGVTLQPDFQYFVRPGGTTNTRDAAALGFRTNINF